jgi:hypothetical protein
MITPCFLASSAAAPALRVAVLLDGPLVPSWVATVLEDIARSNFARVELAVMQRPAEAAAIGLSELLPALAREVYDRVDRAVGGEQDPLLPVNPGAWLADVARLDVPAAGDGELRLPPGALAELRRRGLDVILRLCAAVPRGEVLSVARGGVWSYHHGADEHPRGGTPFFREIAGGAATLDVQLEVLAEEPGDRLVLCRSTFSAVGSMFVAHQRHAPFWETTHFVLWKLHELHERGLEHLRRQASPCLAPAGVGRAPQPTAAEIARLVVPRVASGALRRLRGGPPPERCWRIALRRKARPLFSEPGPGDATDFRWLEASPGRCWADPFLFERGGRTYLFFEDIAFDRAFAGIGCVEVLPDGTVGPRETCLDPGFHLSFPLVFEHEGEVFMLPESLANGTVTLYRARRFPDLWVQEKVLFRGNAVDTAIWHEHGRFYFFTTLCDRSDRGMKTLLFVADSLTGAWRLHPANPVSSDVRSSRGAGAVFRSGGRLFRPVQNCGPCYGYGLRLEEIAALTEERYEARPHCWLDPSRLSIPARGVHTYNRAGEIEAIDSYTFAPRSA